MTLVPLSLSERIRIGDAVYERLRDAICAGVLPPGSKLSIPALAESLGVSRSPVREAVVRLTQERFAREEPRRGAVVATVELPDLVRLYEVREVLEGLAARLAVLHGSEKFIAELTRTHQEHERAVTAGDTTRHMKLDMRFHQLNRSAANNPELLRLLDDIQGQVQLAMLTTTVTSGPCLAVEDHRLILEAITARDAQLAEERARAHIARLRHTLHAQGVSRDDAGADRSPSADAGRRQADDAPKDG
ncbi:GntR family transcriptional regulator [Streptosporangium sp. NPDC006007]|uniref:GntR family transcriptional regulator n=1 Tax=Streptosporangium sp. NPDC006007 TaxID=3154575 RepID=UPI0033B6E213